MGKIVIEVYAHLPAARKPVPLKSITLNIPEDQRQTCKDKMQGTMFEWKLDEFDYSQRSDRNPQEIMLEMFKKTQS